MGDVYDPKYWILKSRSSECFPGLSDGTFSKTELAGLIDLESGDLGFALGLGKVVDAKAAAQAKGTLQLQFRDLEIAQVSQAELARQLSSQCDFLKPIVEEREADLSLRKPYVVIGRIVRGKRDIFVGLQDNADASVAARDVATALGGFTSGSAAKVLAADPSLSASLGFGARKGVIVQDGNVVPIAFTPAFLPQVIFDQTKGPTTGEAKPVALKWDAFNASDPGQIQRFQNLVGDFYPARD